ncbi:MAG: type II toxin-antitoxin system HicA family toxin [Nanoarchaeota archaeon]|nr:type II toxin-antitoxin system HicA family toxin [Nanoarchaeota archaeon]MBU4451416.1 type II toxin-antitoxin system HicA family toxin [Nanoarchaeota archaeon]MCG2724510.1 type II toxin-antitoxin system HicA family toxin [archaeon]
MSKTPVLSGLEVVKALRNAGFEIVGRKGSHVRMKRKSENKSSIALVPQHKELAIGTLKSILKQANMNIEELMELL